MSFGADATMDGMTVVPLPRKIGAWKRGSWWVDYCDPLISKLARITFRMASMMSGARETLISLLLP